AAVQTTAPASAARLRTVIGVGTIQTTRSGPEERGLLRRAGPPEARGVELRVALPLQAEAVGDEVEELPHLLGQGAVPAHAPEEHGVGERAAVRLAHAVQDPL